MGFLKKHKGRFREPSVKEGMDNLPFGIVFADISGMVILCNHAMHGISRVLLGTELQNAALFWQQVEKQGGQMAEGVYILRFSDGTSWQMLRRQCMLNKKRIYEITAQDVTERLRLIGQVEENNRRLAANAERLRQYSKNALELAGKRELLMRKEHMHNELGRLLSATRHYLDSGDVDGNELWKHWHINSALMLEEAALPSETDLLQELYQAAASVGVKLELTGDCPQGELTLEILLAAGGECLTNLLRHARGDALYVKVENREGEDRLTFWNNGILPSEGGITEGGGLSSLRRRTEENGGTMEIVCDPGYQLILTVPVRKGEENV